MTGIGYALDSVGRVSHNSAQDFDLLRVLGIWTRGINLDLTRMSEGLFGVVPPRLASDYYEIMVVDQ